MNSTVRIKNSSKNIVWGIVRQFVLLVLAFSTRTIFVRLLGAEYLGVGGLYSNILTVLSLAEFGVGNVLLYSLYSPLQKNDHAHVRSLILFYKKLYRAIACVIAILGVALIPFLRYIIKSPLPQNELILYYVLYLCNTVASYFAVYKTTLIQADQKVYIKNVVQTTFMALQYGTQIVLLLVWKNFVAYLCVQVFCTLGQNIVLNRIANKKYPWLNDPSTGIVDVEKKNIISNTKSMFVYKLSSVLINNTDNVLISVMLGTVMVGYYTNYYTLITYVSLFVNIFITGVIASLGDMNAENDIEKSYRNFNRLLFVFNLICMVCVSCYIAIVQDFIPIWVGEEYLLDDVFVFALMSNFYITTAVTPVWMYRETMGLFKDIRFVMFAAAILNIVLSIALGSFWGLTGIILATTLARLMTIVWYEPIVLFKRFKMPAKGYFLKQAGYFLVMALITFLSCVASGLLSDICSGFAAVLLKLLAVGLINVLVIVMLFYKSEEFVWLKGMVLGRFGLKRRRK